jgi:peptidoglycan/xylan/chitin deacetylase (PgdA/CDA1 family)
LGVTPPFELKEPFVTVSVDDGNPSDLRAAELLAKLGYSATFYVPARNGEKKVLGATEVRLLAELFELGAHGYDHLNLRTLSTDSARYEIRNGKAWLEDTISRQVNSFCYPLGKFNRRIANLVIEEGFIGARTTQTNIVTSPIDVFTSGVTTFISPRRRFVHARHAVIEGNWTGLNNFARIFRFATDWTDHFERGVSYVSAHGGVAHIWFHSGYLDQHDQWSRLEQLLRRLKGEYQFRCATNGYLFALYSTQRPAKESDTLG